MPKRISAIEDVSKAVTGGQKIFVSYAEVQKKEPNFNRSKLQIKHGNIIVLEINPRKSS